MPLLSCPIPKADDSALVRRMAQGETEAFSEFFERHHSSVMSIALRILRNVTDAEDLMQEVFLELWCTSKTYDPSRGSVKAWVFRYAYHRALNRKKHIFRHSFEPELNLDAVVSPDPNAQLWNGLPIADWKQMIEAVISKLSPEQQRSIEAVYFEGKRLPEVARENGESLSNVKNQVYRGIKKLRRLLGVNGNGRFVGKRTEKETVEVR